MQKVGAITVGQSPRNDVTSDILPVLGKNIQLIERGALDGLDVADIERFAPQSGDYVLVSKLRDGTEVKFAERFILPLLQGCIESLERQGVSAIMFLCTGKFPVFNASVPLFFPNEILHALVPILSPNNNIAVLTPNAGQVDQSKRKWEQYVNTVVPIAASPYKNPYQEIDAAAQKIAGLDVDLVVMDCIGYSREMKQRLKAQTGKKILLPRTMMAGMIKELLD